jgi:hypothetical protein
MAKYGGKAWDAYRELQRMTYRVLENGNVIVETIMNMNEIEKAIDFMSVGHDVKAWRDTDGWFTVDCGIDNQVVKYKECP